MSERQDSLLLPCPFCGKPAGLISDGFSFGVKCLFCGSLLPISYGTREKAKKAWNTRYKESTVYDKEETVEGCTVQILTNTATGETSVGWWRNNEE